MKFLFYFVHPAKYHLFRITINKLKEEHNVDIVINSKDVLEELVKHEGWNYTNIFPKGRNISKNPSVIKSGLKFILTIFRLERYLFRKSRYDIFVTDDALVLNGWFRRIPTYIFNDNDIETIKINKILLYFASKIISPKSTHLGQFENKKIAFKGNKALAHLHPLYFIPNKTIVHNYDLIEDEYILVRFSKINATHDIGNSGISDTDFEELTKIINNKYKVILSSEREISSNLSTVLFNGNPIDFSHLLFFARFFITDSATMATEASVIGTPNFLFNKVGKKCGVNKDLHKNEIQYIYDNFEESIPAINEILNNNLKEKFRKKSSKYLEKCDDLNKFLIGILTRIEYK